jgi:hypothetical protein
MYQPTIKHFSVSASAVFIITFFCIAFSPFFTNWGKFNTPFHDDVNQYYSYIIAVFKYHDITFSNGMYGFWIFETPIHKLVPKVTYGMSLFYLPFFLIAELFSKGNATGYEPIYAWSIHLGCILYVLIGLVYCRKTLLNWFSEKVTTITFAVIFFGSNLFCYTLINSELTHGILFFLISAFVFYVVKWHVSKKTSSFLIFSFILGLITIIRPTEICVGIFPLLIGVFSINQFKVKLLSFLNLKYWFFIGIIFFFIPLFPQLLYWKIQSGQWLLFSYGSSEGFFWTEPKLLNVLFSYRKGWLIYSPLMILSVLGFIILFKKNKALFWGVLIYFLINLYLISAWWDWAFGGSFGMRALVQVGAVLIIPLAYMIQWLFEERKSRIVKSTCYILIAFFCGLNIFQSNLYKHGIISFDGMTKEAYWFTFLKKNYSKEDLLYLKTLVKHPDYNAMRQGKRND